MPDQNPFGTEDAPILFNNLAPLAKIRALQQLTQWCFINPLILREKTEEADHTSWRIEPFGWDGDDRTYFVLDDNRVYRLTEAPEGPPPKQKPQRPPKKGTKAWRALQRAP